MCKRDKNRNETRAGETCIPPAFFERLSRVSRLGPKRNMSLTMISKHTKASFSSIKEGFSEALAGHFNPHSHVTLLSRFMISIWKPVLYWRLVTSFAILLDILSFLVFLDGFGCLSRIFLFEIPFLLRNGNAGDNLEKDRLCRHESGEIEFGLMTFNAPTIAPAAKERGKSEKSAILSAHTIITIKS